MSALDSSSDEKAFQSASDVLDESDEFQEEEWVNAPINAESMQHPDKKPVKLKDLHKLEDGTHKEVEKCWSPFKL